MDFILPVGLGLVGVLFVLIMSAEIFYLFYWRKRRLDGPRLNNVTVAPVNEGEQVEVRNQSRAAVVIDVTCAEYQISTLQQDLVEKLFPTLSSASHEPAHHTMIGPPRMLFTIKEETKEELEGLVDMDCKGGGGGTKSRRSSMSKSLGDIPLSPPGIVSPLSPIGTPFITPLSSPDAQSSPLGTPTRCFSPLVHPSSCSESHSHPGSPVVHKSPCRVMYDYPNPSYTFVSPPLAPPSPTKPTFSFLASRNVPMSYSRSSSSTGNSGKLSPASPAGGTCDRSPSPPASPPVRKPLFLHLASSPSHKRAECVVKTTLPLRSCTYEDYDDDDSCSLSSQSSSPDRSPNFYSTPTPFLDPISFMSQSNIQVPLPSWKGSSFNRRLKSNDFSPPSSPSDDDTPYASPLLMFQSRTQRGETDEEYEASTSPAATDGQQIFTEEKLAPPTREGVLLPIVLPTSFSFQAARAKAMSFHETPPMVLSSDSGGMMHQGPDMSSMNGPDFQKFS